MSAMLKAENSRQPANCLGTDLIWWRATPGHRTLVSLLWNPTLMFPDAIHIEARIYDGAGNLREQWQQPLLVDQPLLIDSFAVGTWQSSVPTDGLLALFACTDGLPSTIALQLFDRLYPVVDWWHEQRHLGTLHSDQAIIREPVQSGNRITEIVVRESEEETNELVILNGDVEQPSRSLRVRITNSSGFTRTAEWGLVMRPFTVNVVPLVELFADIRGFCGEGHLQVEAEFQSTGLFTRPYVQTIGQVRGIFHAGNVATWGALHPAVHSMVGGEVNPIAVIHDTETKTIINVLHSHDGHEHNVLVDVRLFDLDGACVCNYPARTTAVRKGLSRLLISDLLTDPHQPFRGHVSLNFPVSAGLAVPRHLQALAEYRRGNSVARVMCWSDQWNSVIRLAMRDRQPKPTRWTSYLRLIHNTEITTEAWITNAGHPGYCRSAAVHATLIMADQETTALELVIAPFATQILCLESFLPNLQLPARGELIGMLLLESESDLAIMGFTPHRTQPGIAAEHFLSLASLGDGSLLPAAGS